MSDIGIGGAVCGLCGQPMSPDEQMFLYHGASGPCPEAPVCPGCGKQIEDFRSDGTWGCHSCGERGDWASE